MSLTVTEHALVLHILTQLRDENTPHEAYFSLTHTLSRILLIEATRYLPLASFPMRTPMEETTGARISKPIVLVPILRAGLGMLSAATELLPSAKIGFLGLHRNETTGGLVVLRKFAAGTHVPAHTHPLASEWAYVLTGDWEEADALHGPGTLFHAPRGERHGPRIHVLDKSTLR